MSLAGIVAATPGLRSLSNPGFRRLLAFEVAALGALRLALLLLESFNNSTDYRAYFLSFARMAWQGDSPYSVLVPTGEFLTGSSSIYSPAFVLLMWPWTVLPEDPGRLIWLGLEVAAVGGTLFIVHRGLGGMTVPELLVSGTVLVFFPPLVSSLHLGQVSLMLGFLLATAMLAHQRDRPLLGGVALGLAIAIKLTPVLVLPYFLYRRDWRLSLSALVTAAILAVLTLPAGWASYWPTFIASIISVSNGTGNIINQSLNGVILRVWDMTQTGLPIASPGLGFRLIWLAAQLGVVVGLAALVRGRRLSGAERLWGEYACIVLLLPLIQPFAWEHHFAQAILAVPVAVYLVSRGRFGVRAAAALAAGFVAFVLLGYPAFVFARGDNNERPMNSVPLQLAASVPFIAIAAGGALLATARSSRDP